MFPSALLSVGKAVDSIGNAVLPQPSGITSRSPAPSSYQALPLLELSAQRTVEQAQANAWRAENAQRDSKTLGKVIGSFVVVSVVAWLTGKKKT